MICAHFLITKLTVELIPPIKPPRPPLPPPPLHAKVSCVEERKVRGKMDELEVKTDAFQDLDEISM